MMNQNKSAVQPNWFINIIDKDNSLQIAQTKMLEAHQFVDPTNIGIKYTQAVQFYMDK